MAFEFTLNKFGVPVDGGRQGPMMMPKKKYLFRVRFLNFGSIGNTAVPLTLNAQTIKFPVLKQATGEVHAYNSIAYFPGKSSWDPVDCVVRDDVTNSVNTQLDAQIQRQFDHFNQTGYRSATDVKFTTFLETMDGGNTAVLETWQLEGCFLTDYAPDGMDYTAMDGFKTISFSIRYDNATHYDEAGNPLMATPAADPQGSTL